MGDKSTRLQLYVELYVELQVKFGKTLYIVLSYYELRDERKSPQIYIYI